MKPKKQPQAQPLAAEILESCLGLIRTKFYQGDDKNFFQDRRLLLKWVVLWPASWLRGKGVTIHGSKYREIFARVMLQAAAHIESKVRYRPAYLKQVIQSHFAILGDEYLDEAKSIRNQLEATMLLLGKIPQKTPDPVAELATAAQLLTPRKRSLKRSFKPAKNLQLNLL